MPINYQNGKIYILKSNETDFIYVGSTTQSLKRRLSEHRKHYRYYKNNKYKYMSSFEIMKYGNVCIELYELYPCNSSFELHRREGQLIRELDCVNKSIAGRTREEHYKDNKEKIKQYYLDNKEQIIKRQKKYYQNNKEHFKEYGKEYRKNNSAKIECECGSIISKYKLSDHRKSKKHIRYVNTV